MNDLPFIWTMGTHKGQFYSFCLLSGESQQILYIKHSLGMFGVILVGVGGKKLINAYRKSSLS